MSSMAREMFGVTRGVDDRERRRSHPSRNSSSSASGGGDANYGVPVRRPDGVTRELFMLTGGKTPVSLMPTAALGLASKPVARRKWEVVKFDTATNPNIPSSRSIKLKHWAPVGQPHDQYAFARFNKPVRIITYTEQEYLDVVQHLMPLNVDEKLVPAFKKAAAEQALANNNNNNRPSASAAVGPIGASNHKTPQTTKAAKMQLRVASRIEKITRCKKDNDQSNPANSAASIAGAASIAAATSSAAASAGTPKTATPKTPVPPKLPIPATSPKTPIQKTPVAPSPSIAVAAVTPARSPKSPKNTTTPPAVPTTPGGTPKTWKDLVSPIMKGPSAAPPSSVAAGTRKSFTASPKALALAAEAANITLPDPSIVKTVKPPRTPRQTKPPKRYSEENGETPNISLNNSNTNDKMDDKSNNEEENNVQVVKSRRRNTKKTYTKEAVYDVKLQKPWTREETDTLFELCERYDLRFAVIYDRWDLEERSVEELKDRYYSVAKGLIEYRTRTNKDALTSLPLSLQKHCQAITMNPYDYEYECIRKNQQEWQYKKSKKEMKEEEAIVREGKRIEQNRKRLLKERTRLAKLLATKDEQSGDRNGQYSQGGNSSPGGGVANGFKFQHRKITTGAFARSSLIYTPISNSSKSSKRIDSGLIELGVGTRPTPTGIVVDNFDLLRMDILRCIELDRTVAKKEEEVHSLRVKLAKLKGEAPPAPPAGVNLSHKKRKLEEVDFGSLFGSGSDKKNKEGDEKSTENDKEENNGAVAMDEGD